MATMNISLPDQMHHWVEDAVQSGRYENASDYIRDLIRNDKKRDGAFDQIQNLITEGMESGVSAKSIDDVWKEVSAQQSNPAA